MKRFWGAGAAAKRLHQKVRDVRLLALDVDGVLSDGGLHYCDNIGGDNHRDNNTGGNSTGGDGGEAKTFFTRDGLGIKLLQRAGVAVAIITGRNSPVVARRAAELGITHVVQGRDDKLTALEELCATLNLKLDQVAYMGDDLPDLGAIQAAGVGMAPADADAFVAAHADWRSQRPGGRGAVREACEFILHCRGGLAPARAKFLPES